MNNIYVIIDQLTDDYSPLFLEAASFLAILCGIFVIVTKNPIVSVLFLIGLFISVACTLSLIGLNFLGLSYLLVYVGAVSILFLFILMLMSIRSSDLKFNSINIFPLGLVVINYLSITIYRKIYEISPEYLYLTEYKDNDVSSDKNPAILDTIEVSSFDLNNVLYVSNLSWDKHLMEFSHITSIGNILYTNYSIWLILASLILLLAMVGSIVITIKPSYNN